MNLFKQEISVSLLKNKGINKTCCEFQHFCLGLCIFLHIACLKMHPQWLALQRAYKGMHMLIILCTSNASNMGNYTQAEPLEFVA